MKVIAYKRAEQGTGASRRLRTAGMAPGIVYGGDSEPVLIKLDHNALFYALKREAFHSSILDLEIDGQAEKVLLRDFQVHAYKPLILHVDFQRVAADKELTTEIPLHFLNEDTAPAAKGGVIHRAMNSLEVTCLPANLPAFIEVDLSSLSIGDTIHISDLKLPEGVRAASHENEVIVSSEAAAAEEPAEGEGTAAEGEAKPAEEK